MATLTGETIASTYLTLLKLTTAALGADDSAKFIEDAAGTDSALSLSTTRVGIGTSTPQTTLHLSNATADAAAVLTIGGADVQDNDILGEVRFGTHESSQFNMASIVATAEGDPNPGQGGCQLALYNTKNGEDGDGTDKQLMIYMKENGITYFPAGNVGIGTTSPEVRLHVSGTSMGSLGLSRTDDSGVGDDQDVGQIYFGVHGDDTTPRWGAKIVGTTSETWSDGGTDNGMDLEFYTCDNTTDDLDIKFIITENGRIGNTSAPNSACHIKGATTDSSKAIIHAECTEPQADSGDVLLWLDWSVDDIVDPLARWIDFHDADGTIGRLESSGTQIDTAFTQESDIRYKENIVDTALKGLEILNKVKVRDFEWNEKYGASKAGKKVTAGFVADELYEVYPAATKGTPGATKIKVTPAVKAVEAVEAVLDDDGNVLEEAVEAVEAVAEKTEEVIDAMGVMEGAFTRLLIKAVQELSAKVTALENA